MVRLTRKSKFIIGFWVIFVLIFIVSHKFLAKIILDYQQQPAIETKEAYQLVLKYQQSVMGFYHRHQRCPVLADKASIISQEGVYQYVKTIRFMADPVEQVCYIAAVMREDTPSKPVKGRLVVIAYDGGKQQNSWSCYTDVRSKYTIKPCLNKSLPVGFKQAFEEYEKLIRN